MFIILMPKIIEYIGSAILVCTDPGANERSSGGMNERARGRGRDRAPGLMIWGEIYCYN